MSHLEESPLAGERVTLANGVKFDVYDWWDRINGNERHPLHIVYRARVSDSPVIPNDDGVLYGKIGNVETLVHLNEIEDT